jgi:DNA-directed RNA polymerase specialized sigma24 family protein
MMVDFIRENQRNWQIIDEFIKTISGTSQEELLKKFERKERLKIVLNAINTLGRGCKLIFILLANDEIERKDICRSMGFSKGALENRILNCRDKLKKLIKYRINNFYAL